MTAKQLLFHEQAHAKLLVDINTLAGPPTTTTR
jgi:hypothetical protein